MILKEVTANYEYLSLGELARPLMRSASIYTQNRAQTVGSDGLPALPRSGAAGPGPTEAETLVQAEVVRGLLHQVFLRILQSLVSPVHAPRYAAVKRARRYIEQHVGERITVRDIARAAGLGTVRLHTLFRAETGETPAEYVLRQRLERSADMLRNSAVSIASIADRFGFSSSQNFARSFRKYFRTTPTACRRSAVAKR